MDAMPVSHAPSSPAPFRLAVLMTCHNRRDTSLRCLEALFAQEGLPANVQVEVYVVDDGSTDGTGEAVRSRFPQVRVLPGNGELYWAGGMRLAWDEASRTEPDAYLWLNDDTYLKKNALEKVYREHQIVMQTGHPGIFVGCTRGPDSEGTTYGGCIKKHRWRPLSFSLVESAGQLSQCDTMNGNFVWVPAEVFNVLGTLDPVFSHSMGDIDYGLRATARGIPIWVVPGWVGICARNSTPAPWLDISSSIYENWHKLNSPKGLPYTEWKYLAWRHGGAMAPILVVWPYFNIALKFLKKKLLLYIARV